MEPREATYTLNAFGVTTRDLTLDEGFLSIRRNGDVFEGQASFNLTVSGTGAPRTISVGAPFSVAIP